MEEIINILQSNGNKILSSPLEINNATPPINTSSNDFIIACNISIQNSNKPAIVGICFNLGPYISNNFEKIDQNIFWDILIQLVPFINEQPTIYGYLEAVTELSIKSRKVNDKYLLFLANKEMQEPYTVLKPLILAAVFDYLPNTFIYHNTDYFLPLVINSFQSNDFLFRSNLLLILSKMKLNIQTINSIPNFSNIVWNFIFEASLTSDNFQILSNSLEKFRSLVPDFFDMPNNIISENLKLINETNLFGLVRLIPFLNSNDFQVVFQALLSYSSSNISVHPILNEAILDSQIASFHEQTIQFMFSVLSKNLIRVFDDVSIYIYSLYFELFEDLSKDSALYLIKSINLAFSSIKSNKSILYFSIYQIAEQYKTRSKLLRNSIVPALINAFTLNDNECSRYASKSFIKLFQTNTLPPSEYLDKYLLMFDEVIMMIPNYSLYCLKKYFKVLCKIVLMKEDDDYIDNKDQYDKSLIIQFVKNHICRDDIKLVIKSYFLELCTSLARSFPDEFEPLSNIASIIAINLLKSDIDFSYPIAAEFILFSREFSQIDQIYKNLIDISSGKVTNVPKIIRVTSYYTAIISSNQKLNFPSDIIKQQLSFQNDYIYQSRAINNLQYTFPQYKDETLAELLQYIIQISKLSQSSVVVDSAFVLLKILIKQKPEFAFPFASDLILSTLQGRISLLDHNFPFNYDHRKFKFYKCLSSFISHYKDKSASIILELIDWIPLASDEILPQIVKTINRALAVLAIPANGIPILWINLLDKLKEGWHNTDLANYLLGCLVNMLIDFPTICNSDDLLQQIEYMWESKDDEMVLILPQIFLDVWSNTNSHITFSLYHEFIGLIITEECKDWSFPLMMKYLIKIVKKDNSQIDDDYIIDAARALAHFILKDKEEKQELEFDDDIISEMKNALNICNLKCKLVKSALLNEYQKYPGKINVLNQIFDIDI